MPGSGAARGDAAAAASATPAREGRHGGGGGGGGGGRGPMSAAQWVERHGDALYAYALRRVRRADVAEDLVQETLLGALSAAGRFGRGSSERTWLIGILKHKVLDHLRRQDRRAAAESDGPDLDYFFTPGGAWRSPPRRWDGDPASLAESREFRAALDACLAKLPGRLASVFVLREAEGMTTDDLCKDTGLSPTNVWSILHRARLRLRECLTANWFGREAPVRRE